MSEKQFNGFSINGINFFPNSQYSGIQSEKLPAGMYIPRMDRRSGDFWFEKMNVATDNIIDLPSPEYSRVTTEINEFMTPEIKQKFVDMGYVYKRSVLMYGLAGTGKTVISNRLIRDAISNGAVVLWGEPDTDLITNSFKVLNNTQPDNMTMVVFEEFDTVVEYDESKLLTLLDGQVQKNNVVYLATTNYLEKIPKRIYRPGRFSSVIEVKYPNAEAREVYFKMKLGNVPELGILVEKTNNLSIDELKEIVQSCYIFKYDLDTEIKRLRDTRSFEVEVKEDEEVNILDTWSLRDKGNRD